MNEVTHSLAPDLCIQPSSDANQQAANLTNWQQEYDQLSNGRYMGQIIERRFSHIHVFREDSNRALKQACRVEVGGLWLGISAQQKSLHLNHAKVSANHMLLRSGGVDFELITPDAFSIYGMVLDQHLLESISEQVEFGLGDIDKLCQIESQEQAIQLKNYLALLLAPKPTRWSSHTHEALLKDFVAEQLTLKPNTNTHLESPYRRQKIMGQIKQYLENIDTSNPITISELCEAVHVSRRTLQYSFEACCGMAPQQFIQRQRLNQVRRVLQDATDTRAVYEIAFSFGFYHLGQFAKSYKRLFGEKPSETKKTVNK
ncbi:helix-turn-helix domain-containing protein [Photobacterium sp. DNB23_23_1]